MRLSANKILAIIAVVLVLVLLLSAMKHKTKPDSTNNTSQASVISSDSDAASGDTNAESLRELTAQYQKVVKDNQRYQQQLAAQNQHPSTTVGNGVTDNQLQAMQQAQTKTQEELKQLETQLINLQQQSSQTNQNNTGDNHYPINTAVGQSPRVGMITTVSDMHTDVTLSASVPPMVTSSSATPVIATNNNQPSTAVSVSHIPYYTIPALSNLANTVLMTSLIGEVPQGSTFPQPPFPFLALVGKNELLAANGMYLPSNLAGMKIAGYSVGVGSFLQGISCTRAYITQVLFVFDDGTSFTVQGKNTSGNNISPDDTLGYLSDPYGNPCIQGKYITNANRVIAMLTGAGFADGVSKGISEAQTNTMTGFDGSTTVFNGSIGKYAAGNGVSTGVEDAANYMQERLKGTFDVVYVPASNRGIPTHVIANFTKNIVIDLNQNGRKIVYDHDNTSNITAMHGLD